MTNSLWTPSSVLASFLTAIYLQLTAAILLSMPSPLLTSAQVMAPVSDMILPSCMWPPPLVNGFGSVNNLLLRIGPSGHRLYNWHLAPNSLLQFCWEDGSNLHTNHPSIYLTTLHLISFTNQAIMVSGKSSPSYLMPWLPIALPATTTPVLLPLS